MQDTFGSSNQTLSQAHVLTPAATLPYDQYTSSQVCQHKWSWGVDGLVTR